MHTSSYFWRTITQQEIDLIEERNGQIDAYEFKWKMKGRRSLPPSFTQTYNSSETIVHQENFRDFISPEKKKTK